LRPDGPTLIEDVATYPLWDESDRTLFVERFGAKSAMFFPMVVRGQWIGYINAVYDKPTQFPEADVRRLMALSAQTAVAVQSLRQLEEIQARAHSEQQLRQVITIINASEDLIADLPVIAQHLRELAPAADIMALTSYTPGEPEFTYFAASMESDPSAQTGASDVQQGHRLPLKGSGPEWVIVHKEPWLGADIR
jgi:transcriptional regulator with GAF, ATPase, and Fis domain